MGIANSLRRRVLALVLFPILAVVPAVLALSVYWGREFIYEGLLRQVSTDLAVATDVFQRIQQDHLNKLEGLANSYAFRTALEAGDMPRLADQLSTLRETADFDFLHLSDPAGRWLPEQGPEGAIGSKPTPLRERAAQWGIPGVGIEVFSAEELRREGQALVEQARMALVATPRSPALERTVEDRALVLRAVVPVRGPSGQITALLDGGVLLNRNSALVDAMRDLVYGPESLPEGVSGALTLVLDRVRVATNVPSRAGGRAVGTPVADVVRQRVLGEGETVVDRTFVVNEWYISGYRPIEDVAGRRVGMLYVGFPEAPHREAYSRGLILLVLLLVSAAGLGAALAVHGARTIFRPVEAMTAVVRATQAGQERRIGDVRSRDELGELAREFDRMLDLLGERNDQLCRAAEELERKVQERTAELREKNRSLQRTVELLHETRHQLIAAEKLAAMGELTAGVAHEINNPTAVILGNMEVLESELGEHTVLVREEIDLIYEQVARIRSIVSKLLQYSRAVADARGEMQPVSVNETVADTLLLVKHEAQKQRTRIVTELGEDRPVMVQRHDLQQVLVNLIVNAVHAAGRDGTVRVRTEAGAQGGATIIVVDDGPGIPSERLSRVFDPFFTTKGSQGTGLGLSVSYGIVRAYGGTLDVSSRPGEGTRFEIHLPVAAAAPPEKAEDRRAS